MKTVFAILGSLVLFGLLIFALSLLWAWLERRRAEAVRAAEWDRMSVGEKLDAYSKGYRPRRVRQNVTR